MNLKKGDVVQVNAIVEADLWSQVYGKRRALVFKLPAGYEDAINWRVRCLLRCPSDRLGIVVGYGIRQVGILTDRFCEFGSYTKIENVSVVMVQPTVTQRWLKPWACLEEDLIVVEEENEI